MLFGKICQYCRKEYSSYKYTHCPYCDDIDFANIDSVTIMNTEMTYRTESEEEFDPVMTNFLTDQDGWQHYETQTVEYEVENGYNITFIIHYTDGKSEWKTYHESHPIAQRLQEISENHNVDTDFAESLQNTVEILSDTSKWSSPFDYDKIANKFSQMARLYNILNNPTEQELVEAARLKITSILMSDMKEYIESIQELLFYILAENSDDNDDFAISDIRDIIFTQNTATGVDAFAILDANEDANDDTVVAYERKRVFNKFRKVLITTLGNNTSKLKYKNIIIWDMKMIISAYMKAFEKATNDMNTENNHNTISQEKENFVVIDFETTGINNKYDSTDMDEILSVSIINQDGEVVLDTLCSTERKRSWYQAQCMHGISPQMVQGYPTFRHILPQVLEILSSVDFVIAYNINFERNFVESYIKRTNSINLMKCHINWDKDKDPMVMYKKYIGSQRWVKLEVAAGSFGYTFNAHDSLEDVKATLFLYNQLK